jgi:type II secretory pathway component PulM
MEALMSELDMMILLALVLVVFVAVVLMKAATLRAQRKVLASMQATLAAIEENHALVAEMRKAGQAASVPNRGPQP